MSARVTSNSKFLVLIISFAELLVDNESVIGKTKKKDSLKTAKYFINNKIRIVKAREIRKKNFDISKTPFLSFDRK